MPNSRVFRSALLATAFVILLPLQAAAFQLLSHRAIYDLSLEPGAESSIQSVGGRLVIEWVDTCSGYTTEQRMLMRMGVENGVIDSDFQFSSWESKDGDQFRYDVKTTFSGQQPKVFRGRAKRQASAAMATFTRPKDLELELPGEVVFPSEHMVRMIEQAEKGERRVSMRMFDGIGEEGVFDAVAFVLGPAKKPLSDVPKAALPAITQSRGWRIQWSFFDASGRDQMPTYQVSTTLYSNGISGDIIMKYPDFSVRGKLSGLKLLPPTGC